MTMEILKVQDLCKTYGKGEAKVEALKKVSLSLDKGEFAAVVGESGSGKSTLLNCIGALDTPTCIGNVSWHYDDCKQPKQQCGSSDRVFRPYALYRCNAKTGYAPGTERGA